MDRKEELQQRIIQGHRNLDRLCTIAGELPKGPKRNELGDKSVRLLTSLSALEDGFIELYPNKCLFQEKRCNDGNKGCFPCWKCPSYLNIRYRQEMLMYAEDK